MLLAHSIVSVLLPVMHRLCTAERMVYQIKGFNTGQHSTRRFSSGVKCRQMFNMSSSAHRKNTHTEPLA